MLIIHNNNWLAGEISFSKNYPGRLDSGVGLEGGPGNTTPMFRSFERFGNVQEDHVVNSVELIHELWEETGESPERR